MPAVQRLLAVLFALLTVVGGRPVLGQTIDLSGRAFGDYFYAASAPDSVRGVLPYPLSVPDSAREGLHGLTYRRLYLTLDFQLSRRLKGRARLEANDGTTGPSGPIPFVKDLWVEWQYWGGHSATVGVTEPPAFEISSNVWGYRSLERTILNRRGVVDSRDFGLRLDGPLLADGTVRYAFMYGNNSAARPEQNQNKRVYGRLSASPSGRIVLAAGGDYATHGDHRDRSLRLSAFAGYEGEDVRVGLKGYRAATTRTDTTSVREYGASLFGHLHVTQNWGVVARADWTLRLPPATDPLDVDPVESLLLAGVTYRPHPSVEVVPNVWIRNSNRHNRSDVLLRLTLDLTF
ncbi:MAG: hypothetical protein ABEL04_00110 [Salinibacter sp.]|uniref:hypothetical protein n=1 Tax=Salinibacter sp. TaxID=2065818 RepID=UPI0035D40F3F